MTPNEERNQSKDVADTRRRIREALTELDTAHGAILHAAALISTLEGLSAQWDELGMLAETIKEASNSVENAGRQKNPARNM